MGRTTSPNIGEECMGPSPLKFFWGTVPVVPLGLRPWMEETKPKLNR